MKIFLKKWINPLFVLFMCISMLSNCHVTSNNINELSSKAEQGDATAQNNLGNMYYKGEGVVQNYKEAVKWLRKAAEQGIPQAQYNLGMLFSKGLGVTQDYKEAAKWFRKAAEQGMPQAQYNLGNWYYRGQGVEQDYKEAVYWYRKAAEQGIPEAQNNLGLRYANGQGVPRDYKEAVKWLRKAAEQGIPQAINVLEDLCGRMPGLCGRMQGNTQEKIDNLRKLSTTTAVISEKEDKDINSTLSITINNIENANSYCSYTELKNFDVNELKSKDYVFLEWRLDFNKPDNFLVTQYIAESDLNRLYDQWISIGDSSYQNAGLWSRSEDRRHYELNRFLTVDAFLKLLSHELVDRYGIYFYNNSIYLAVSYMLDSSNDILNFTKKVFDGIEKSLDKCPVTIWINMNSKLISKGTIKIKGKTKYGENVNMEMSQVFTSFNEDIQIVVPSGLDDRSRFISAPNLPHHK